MNVITESGMGHLHTNSTQPLEIAMAIKPLFCDCLYIEEVGILDHSFCGNEGQTTGISPLSSIGIGL
jgi:hypothetical protein